MQHEKQHEKHVKAALKAAADEEALNTDARSTKIADFALKCSNACGVRGITTPAKSKQSARKAFAADREPLNRRMLMLEYKQQS